MIDERSPKAKLTLSDLYDDDVVYTSRPSYVSNPWLEPEEHQSNFLTGRELLIANRLPVIVHEASVTDKLKCLFNDVGQTLPEQLYTFNSKSTYEQLIRDLVHNEQKKIYFQYVHGDDILAPEFYALDKPTFIALNNKSRISEWTGGKYLPRREVVPLDEFEERVKTWDFPFVLKPGDELPTAGGYGVMICYNASELEKAIQRVRNAKDATQTMIIEEKVEAIANYCVQFAYTPERGIEYIGSAQQLTDDYGFYNGNENAQAVPEFVIEAGREIMDNGVKQGFFGIAGFDLLVDQDDNVYAIDLNFRQNGSTNMLLLEPHLHQGYHKFFSYFAKGDNDHFFNTIRHYVQLGVLYPLSYYDGDWYTDTHVNSRFGCIWHGEDKEMIEALEQEFLEKLEHGN